MSAESEERGYLASPTLHQDRVVFAAEDDLWAVGIEGGVARRLTAGLGEAASPRFTPDGRFIVLVGHEEGEADLYRLSASGGPLTRLTAGGGVAGLAGFDREGAPVASIGSKVPFGALAELYRVPLDGAPMERLNLGPASHIAFGPGAAVVLARKAGDLARWKRYRGGTAGELWIDEGAAAGFKPYRAPQNGNLTDPMWVGGRIYFLSDFEGIGNLYSIRPSGADLQRHTHHEEFYARAASTDGQRIMYQAGGDLYVFDPAAGESHQIAVVLNSQRQQRARRFVDAASFWTDYRPHPEADRLLAVTRGQLFDFAPFDGPVVERSPGSGVRVRLARWLSASRVVYADDHGGENRLVMAADGGAPEVLWAGDLGQLLALEPNPTGTQVAYVNHRLELWLVSVADRRATRVAASGFGPPADLAWSPDGRYLAYSAMESPVTRAIHVLDATDGAVHPVTRPVHDDTAPAWDPLGRYLYFLGVRYLDPVYDTVTFDMGFPQAHRPYAVMLAKTQPSPFVGAPPNKPAGEGKDSAEGKADGPRPVQIDFEGIEDRVVPFPVAEGQYRELAALEDKVLWLKFPVQGERGRDLFAGPPPAGDLMTFDLTQREAETLAPSVVSMRLAADGKHLAYRTGARLRWISPSGKVPESDAAGRKGRYVDWARVPVMVDPPAEWAQMLREAWRMMRDNFWTEDMSQVDWAGMYDRYAALLPRVSTRGELSDLLWELQGELGTSHAYEMGGDRRAAPPFAPGYLGADFVWDAEADGWRITHIVQGDAAVAGHDSALRTPGANVSEGDVVVAIDGRRVSPTSSPEHLLMRRREQEVSVTLTRPGAAERTVVVKTLASERLARYREWVEANRAYVHRESGGRVGYLHIPNMMAWGFSEFFRLYAAEVLRPALIVDVRFNGGGHVSQLLLEKLSRRPVGYSFPRRGVPETYPLYAARGPMLALTNDYAGSDGDIFSHSFKLLHLGTLVGRRTWGGVIGIEDSEPLVDGTIVTQPSGAYWFHDVGWGVENHGTDPDIVVEYPPEAYAAGQDPQLQRTLQEALAQLESQPAQQAPDDPRPSKAPPKLVR